MGLIGSQFQSDWPIAQFCSPATPASSEAVAKSGPYRFLHHARSGENHPYSSPAEILPAAKAPKQEHRPNLQSAECRANNPGAVLEAQAERSSLHIRGSVPPTAAAGGAPRPSDLWDRSRVGC